MAVRIILLPTIVTVPMVVQSLGLRLKACHRRWLLSQLACNVHIGLIVRPPIKAEK